MIILHHTVLGCWNAGEDGTDGLNGTDALGGSGSQSSGYWDGNTWILDFGS